MAATPLDLSRKKTKQGGQQSLGSNSNMYVCMYYVCMYVYIFKKTPENSTRNVTMSTRFLLYFFKLYKFPYILFHVCYYKTSNN